MMNTTDMQEKVDTCVIIHHDIALPDFGPSAAANLFLKLARTFVAHIDQVNIDQFLGSSSTKMIYECQHKVMIAQTLCILMTLTHFSVRVKT